MLSMVVHICIPSTGGEGTWTQRPEYSVQGQPAWHSKTMSQEKNKQNPHHNNKSKSFRRYTQTTAPFLGSHSQEVVLASCSATSPEQDHLRQAHWETQAPASPDGRWASTTSAHCHAHFGSRNQSCKHWSKPTSNPCVRK